MGRVSVHVEIENLDDVYRSSRGELQQEQIRRVIATDALVDTGATGLAMPRRLILELGLMPIRTRKVLSTAGYRDVATYGAVRLTIQGRDCICDVTEIADECPILIGQVPLELLDYIVDMRQRQLLPNPAHHGEQLFELL
jgi:clan AA aspartic protease